VLRSTILGAPSSYLMMSFIVLSFSLLARVLKEPFSRLQCATSSRICRGLRRENCELALECLAYTCAPTLGDGQRRGIGKDILFAFLQPIEDFPRRGFRRHLRYVEAAVHIGVNRAQNDGMDHHALARQERSQRLRQVERGRLRKGVGGNDRQGRESCQG